ncbi:MBL fold metallo-hydrolase [Streptomyces sp. NPDC048751]|uniref:MBL fold metallo-hydrolase n=1 Tax=Streptomyces sp. NPDC048751 TaxID=3365591 RepID=UPI00371BAF4A
MVAVPGHTPGSVAFHLPAQGAVFTGDALVTHDGLLGLTGTGPQIIGPVFTHDTAQAHTSLEALTSLGVSAPIEVVLPTTAGRGGGRPRPWIRRVRRCRPRRAGRSLR